MLLAVRQACCVRGIYSGTCLVLPFTFVLQCLWLLHVQLRLLVAVPFQGGSGACALLSATLVRLTIIWQALLHVLRLWGMQSLKCNTAVSDLQLLNQHS
jgi:hypothetical protein